jgi:two-component system cell cycle sensor histidine kinase/response regulator CckA
MSKNGAILVLEDEDDARYLIAAALRSDGFCVLEAGHPRDAIKILESDRYKVELLIIDIMLPEIQGDKFAREILDEHPFIKIIFASAMSEEELESRINQVRYQCFLQKPFTIEALREAVRITLLHGSISQPDFASQRHRVMSTKAV